MLNKRLKQGLVVGITSLSFLGCSKNPFTNKKTLAIVPNSQLFPSSFQQYNTFLNENKVITGTEDAEMIARVGKKIAVAAERWLMAAGHADYLKDYKWEYNLVNDSAVNAWCMPGGKIVFYTGILPIAQNEAGVAAIMGHEVAHALANHGQQRMSAGMLQQVASVAGSVALSGKSAEQQKLFATAFGYGSQLGVMLPFSRSHETEADKIGLTLSAIAGYEPAEAVELWKRMKANSGGQAPPEILSTHPSNDTRIKNLTAWVPEARSEAKKFGVNTFKIN